MFTPCSCSTTVHVQVKLSCPDHDAVVQSETAASILWKIFRANVEDLGLKVTEFASSMTESGLDVKSMYVNQANDRGTLYD